MNKIHFLTEWRSAAMASLIMSLRVTPQQKETAVLYARNTALSLRATFFQWRGNPYAGEETAYPAGTLRGRSSQ
jgi:hypothetical protein